MKKCAINFFEHGDLEILDAPEKQCPNTVSPPLQAGEEGAMISSNMPDEKKEAEKAHRGVMAIRGRGIGFVKIPDREEDIMIPPEAVELALDSDVVEIVLDPPKPNERQTGSVVRILERARKEYIGMVEMRGISYRLKPDNRHIHRQFILPETAKQLLGMKVAANSPDKFGSLLAVGCTVWVVGQACINMGAVVGILPVSGIPLPFVSFGGSSLISTMAATGILANVSRHTAKARVMAERPVGVRRELSKI